MQFYSISLFPRDTAALTVPFYPAITLLDDVKASDRQSIPDADTWYNPSLLKTMVLVDTGALWTSIKAEYHGRFKVIVYGTELPEDDKELCTERVIKDDIRNA